MKISIIIPVYNVGCLLHRCMESVLGQTGCKCEIIIVDDGSTDHSGMQCDRYADMAHVTVIHKSNGGLSSARNAGIDAAVGDYLMFLDSDDYLRPGALCLLADLLESCHDNPDFVQFRYAEVSSHDDNTPAGHFSTFEILTEKSEMFERMLDLGGVGASACTKLIARRMFNKLRFKEGIVHEDELFTTHLISHAGQAAYIENDLYLYVTRQGSIIMSPYSHCRLDIVDILEEQIGILQQNRFEELAKRVRGKLFTVLCRLYIEARRAREMRDVRFIKCKLQGMAASGELPTMQGAIRFIARGLKQRLPVLELYYLYTYVKNGKDKKCLHQTA